ncbi:site-specific integrase [Solirhodobacter olei]|uniref:site-specific integrase n=1 Tax=Solirhodobacter olei TaxID=2493082 RepID=UPI000FD95990|nr:site-specific integrase [Solirhodobacter olei]
MLDSTSIAIPTMLPDAKAQFQRGDFDATWADTTRLKIRGSVNKIAKVYRAVAGVTSPQLIACDVTSHDALFEPYLRSKSVPENCGFKDYTSFYTWYSNSRRFMDVASGSRERKEVLKSLEDDWAKLIDHLSGQCGTPAWFEQYEMIAISVLAAECRERGIGPGQVTAPRIMRFVPEVRAGARNALRTGCQLLDSLWGTNKVPSALLPPAPIGDLPAFIAADRRQTPPVAETFAALRDEYVAIRVNGTKVLPLGTQKRTISTEGVGPDRAKSIKQAIDWYWSGLCGLDLVDEAEAIDPRGYAEPYILHDVVMACADGKLGGTSSVDTRRGRTQTVREFLEWLSPGFKTGLPDELFDAVQLSRDPNDEGSEFDAFKRQTCLSFVDSIDRQRRFFQMPKHFFDLAQPLIANFADLHSEDQRCEISREQHRALDLAIMAANTAIATRFPLRLATRAELLSGGPRKHILFPEASKDVVFNIPGHIVKNGHFADGVPIEPSCTVNPRAILEWYLAEAHPLILAHKVRTKERRQPNLLFCGLHIETLRRIWRRHTAEAGCYITPHMCRHVLATLLYADGVPLDIIAELLGDKVGTVAKSYAFVNRAKLIQGAMEALARKFKGMAI